MEREARAGVVETAPRWMEGLCLRSCGFSMLLTYTESHGFAPFFGTSMRAWVVSNSSHHVPLDCIHVKKNEEMRFLMLNLTFGVQLGLRRALQ